MSARWQRSLQVALSALAGFIDAIGFLMLGGIYVAFMSGSSTLMGIGAGTWNPDSIKLPAAVVGCFVAGVMLGTLVGGRLDRLRPMGVLLVVAGLLAAAAGLCRSGHVTGGGLLLAVAMGTENTVFNRPGVSGIGLTYMTGTLVRIGQRLGEAFSGGSWASAMPDVLLWLGMMVGAGLGVLAFHLLGLDGLWIGAGVVLVLAALALWAAPSRSKAEAEAARDAVRLPPRPKGLRIEPKLGRWRHEAAPGASMGAPGPEKGPEKGPVNETGLVMEQQHVR
ncbi:MAG: YoaK family protein [Janthinobacterium lividum]